MEIITSHLNLDFDGLASMVAAGKLYPKAKLVLPEKLNPGVRQFLALYRDSIEFCSPQKVDWELVKRGVLVDTANLKRTGSLAEKLRGLELHIYDHHPPSDESEKGAYEKIEELGAAVTLLVEELREKDFSLSSFEATILALGIYTDTGSMSYLSTTARDLSAAAYLLERGANLAVISRFSEKPLLGEQQEIFNSLLRDSREYNIRGVDILISTYSQEKYQGGLPLIAGKMLEVTGVNALFLIIKMDNKVWLVGRSSTELLDVRAIISEFGGGGHAKAASATIKSGNIDEILEVVEKKLPHQVIPSVTARDIISYPVKTVSPETKISEAAKVMLRYGHTGLPVFSEEQVTGIISRRDVDKAIHHGLGHAPVKGFMSTNVKTIAPEATLEEIQNAMIEHNVGRLPVMAGGHLVGIVSRSDVLSYLHGENIKEEIVTKALPTPVEKKVTDLLKESLSEHIYKLLVHIGKEADRIGLSVFLVGGIVRDLLLGHENEDIDIVVEGDAISFAERLAEELGGSVTKHEQFGTATWKEESGLRIDFSTARREYYDYPAALPTVERSSLKEDLYRRDFTINAMAIQLSLVKEKRLIDYFHGWEDLQAKRLKVLYNLSFVEDPTRILRAVRFEERFEFQMDNQTEELALNAADLIASVSEPRVSCELKALFLETDPASASKRLSKLGMLAYLTGEEELTEKTTGILTRLVTFCNKLASVLKGESRWLCYLAALLSGHPQWKEKLEAFALNKREIKMVGEIAELASMWDLLWEGREAVTVVNLHTHLKKFSLESIAYVVSTKPMVNIEEWSTYLIKRESIVLPLKGDDLKELGIEPGPVYSRILSELEKLVLSGEIVKRDEAIDWVKKYI